MKHATIFLTLLTIAALSLVAAGCGGGGGGGDRLSKPEFVAQANGICKKANDKSDALKPDLPSGFDPTSANASKEDLDTFGDFLDDLVDIFDSEVNELRDLNPPADLEDDFNKSLSLVEETVNEAKDAADAAHGADRGKLKDKLAESQKHSDEADVIGKRLGLTVCAS